MKDKDFYHIFPSKVVKWLLIVKITKSSLDLLVLIARDKIHIYQIVMVVIKKIKILC